MKTEYKTFDSPTPAGSGQHGERYQKELNRLAARGWKLHGVSGRTTFLQRTRKPKARP